MKILTKLSAAVGLALLVLITPLHAATINGSISINGGFVPMGGSSLADATTIDFLEWTGSDYVSGTSGGTFSVAGVSGDFAAMINPFTLGSINDFSFVAPFSPVTPLWEMGGFLFDLTMVTVVEQTSTILILRGAGDVYGNGFDTTDGSWLLTANTILGSTFSWSATTAVPESMTLILFGIGLLGLGGVVRRKRLPL